MSQRIINNYRDHENDKVMNKAIIDTEKEVYKMYDELVHILKHKQIYLFSKGV